MAGNVRPLFQVAAAEVYKLGGRIEPFCLYTISLFGGSRQLFALHALWSFAKDFRFVAFAALLLLNAICYYLLFVHWRQREPPGILPKRKEDRAYYRESS